MVHRGTCESYLFTAIRQYLSYLSGADSREKRMKRELLLIPIVVYNQLQNYGV